MAKRPRALHPNAISLPGISSITEDYGSEKNQFNVNLDKTSTFCESEKHLTQAKTQKVNTTSKTQLENGSFEVVDRNWCLLPPQFFSSLKHPTKSRPRSPGRRKPTISARSNFGVENSKLYDYSVDIDSTYGSSNESEVKAELDGVDIQPQKTAHSKVVGTTLRISEVSSVDTKTSNISSSFAEQNTMSVVQPNTCSSIFTSKSDINIRCENGSPESLHAKDLKASEVLCEQSIDSLTRTKSQIRGDNYVFTTDSDALLNRLISPPLMDENDAASFDNQIAKIRQSERQTGEIAPNKYGRQEFDKASESNPMDYPRTNKSLNGQNSILNEKQFDSVKSNINTGSANIKVASLSKPISSIWQTKDSYNKSDRRRRFKPVAIPCASEVTEESVNLSNTLPEQDSVSNTSNKLSGTFPGQSKGVSLYDSWLLSRKESGKVSSNAASAAGKADTIMFISNESNLDKARGNLKNHIASQSLHINEQNNFAERRVGPHDANDSKFITENNRNSMQSTIYKNIDADDVDEIATEFNQLAKSDISLTRNVSHEQKHSLPHQSVIKENASDGCEYKVSDDVSNTVEDISDQDIRHKTDLEIAENSPDASECSPIHKVTGKPNIIIEYDNESDVDELNETLKRADNIDGDEYFSQQESTTFSSIENEKLTEDEMGSSLKASSPHLSVDDISIIQPPTMFTSDEESDYPGNNTTPEESDEEDFLPPAPPPPQVLQQTETREHLLESLLQQQKPKELKSFHKIPLEHWSENDAAEWLDYVGLGHLKPQFKNHHVDGKSLMDINFPFLEAIGIKTEEERELILSEIYNLAHLDEELLLESEIQDALEAASEQDKEKIIAVLNALRSPVVNPGLEFVVPSTGSSSPRESDGYPVSSDTASLASSAATAEEEYSREKAQSQEANVPKAVPSPQTQAQPRTRGSISSLEKLKMTKKHEKNQTKENNSKGKKRKTEKNSKKEKKSKGFHKLLDSLNLSAGTTKLTKLFGSRKMNPDMQNLLQAGPRAIIRVWPKAVCSETSYCSLLVSMTTTSAEVIKMVIDKYGLEEDPQMYYLKEAAQKKGSSQVLDRNDCPLLRQCQWSDPDDYRLEFRHKYKGEVNMMFEFDGDQGVKAQHSMLITSSTPCAEVIKMAAQKFDLPGDPKDYFLVEVSEENEDDRQVVADHVCPLKLQDAWDRPDHVFRLCRKANSTVTTNYSLNKAVKDKTREQKAVNLNAALDMEASQPDSKVSSVSKKSDNEEFESQQLADIIAGYPEHEPPIQYVDTDSLQMLTPPVGYTTDEDGRSQDEEFPVDVAQEMELIRHQNKQIIEKEHEINRLRRESLVHQQWEMETIELKKEKEDLLRQKKELEDTFQKEISARDREIERLYQRNNELMMTVKEHENIDNENKESNHKEEEISNLKQQNSEFIVRQRELEKELEVSRQYCKNFEDGIKELNELKRENEELLSKTLENIVAKDKLNDELEIERDKRDKLDQELQEKNLQLENLCELTVAYERETNSLKENLIETEDLKQNVIKLTAKLRESENLRRICEEKDREKLELLQRLDTVLARNTELENICKDVNELRKENSMLLEKTKDMEDLRRTLLTVSADLSKAESEIYESRNLKKDKEELAEKFKLMEKHNRELEKKCSDLDKVKDENAMLTERANEMDRFRKDMAKWVGQLGELDELKRKQKETKITEASLTKQLRTLEGTVAQKDRTLKEQEKKIKMMTEVMKDTQARLEEHEQNKIYLDKILAVIKERDPVLLQIITNSLASSEPEEWC